MESITYPEGESHLVCNCEDASNHTSRVDDNGELVVECLVTGEGEEKKGCGRFRKYPVA